MKQIMLFALLMVSVTSNAVEQFELPKSAIRYVYDGDTFYINCIEGLRCNKGKLGVRALGMDTPEMRGKCSTEKNMARAAKQHLVALKDNSTTIIVTPDAKRPYDKYNRLLASVSFDGIDWSDSIIQAELGRVWTGSRGGWCN